MNKVSKSRNRGEIKTPDSEEKDIQAVSLNNVARERFLFDQVARLLSFMPGLPHKLSRVLVSLGLDSKLRDMCLLCLDRL